MKHLHILPSILLAASIGLPVLSACNDDDTVDYTEYYDWRDRNDAYMGFVLNSVKTLGDKAYFTDTVASLSEPYSFRYHTTAIRVLRRANEDSLRSIHKWYTPYYTSTLKTHYTLYDTKSVMDTIEKYAYNETLLNDASVMDRIFFNSPIKADTLESCQVKFFENFTPAGVVVGWGDVLQQMHIGDSYLICIPWFLGYGQAGSGSTIDPYSNLFFRLSLEDITNWGGTVESN